VSRPAAAFFDVDDTLIAVKSVFRFLAFHLRLRGRPDTEYAAVRERVRRAGETGTRTAALAEYFRTFAGLGEAELAGHGRAWFDAELRGGRLFHQPVLDRLVAHAAAGEAVVLVSGSFPPCLDPIAEHVGADVVLCSRPEVRDGRYTGSVATPMIGAAKAAAVRDCAEALGLDLAACSAYGDHVSDLPLLDVVGRPVVVGADPVLVAHAADRGWPALAGVTG
jgi:HAD superfamily hydrolase (TIGR01490 family)